jgi:hypothetical protein
MSRFSGPQGRGAGRAYRARKRAEATGRNAAYAALYSVRDADPGAAVLTAAASCRQPWKTPYENPGSARATLDRLPRHRKLMGLHPYPCPAGHWHLGRNLKRASVAWKSVA